MHEIQVFLVNSLNVLFTLQNQEFPIFCFRRALKIIDKYFPTIVEEQDILGTEERFNNFLKLIDQDVRPSFKTPMKRAETSSEKWNIFEETFNEMLRNVFISFFLIIIPKLSDKKSCIFVPMYFIINVLSNFPLF